LASWVVTCETLTVTWADSDPDVAVTMVVPLAAAVIDVVAPDAVALAVARLAEDHVTVWPDIAAPSWSRTVAVTDAVAPREAMATVLVLSVIEVGTGVGGPLVLLHPNETTPASAKAAGRRIDRIRDPEGGGQG
jgi:hypothetical protein